MPSDKTSQTSPWNPHRRKVKGKMEVEFLPTCGGAQGKQSAAALPGFNPNAPPFVLCLGFLAAGQNGRHPKNWFQGTPLVQSAVQSGTVPSTYTLRVFWEKVGSRPGTWEWQPHQR